MSRITAQVKDGISKYWLRLIERIIASLETVKEGGLRNLYIFLTNNWIIPYAPCPYIRRRVADKRACYSPLEMQVLLNCVLATDTVSNINTACAEIGVFRGGTARILSDHAGSRAVFLFDTFDGLPAPINGVDSKAFGLGDYTERNIDDVAEYVGDKPIIIPGVFPSSWELGEAILISRYPLFSFVHIDVDLYEGTKAALDYFAEKVVTGGIILVHDYTCSSGVYSAVHSFAVRNPRYMLLPVAGGTQAMLIKKGRVH